MELSRKGIFFSAAAVIFLAILTIVISASVTPVDIDTGLYSARSASAVRERLDQVYLPLVVRTTSTQALIALTTDAYNKDQYLVLPRDFAQAVENKSWADDPTNHKLTSLTLDEAFEALENASNTTGTRISVDVKSVSISQIGSFTAQVTAKLNYTLISTDSTVRYVRNITIITEVPLQEVLDLSYSEQARNEGFAGPKRVFRAQLPKYWNNTEFNRTWNQSLYMVNERAPSVFNRLQGLNTASPYGVETLIQRGIAIPNNTTSLDWEYFPSPRTQYTCTYEAFPVGPIVSYVTLTEYNLSNAVNVQGNASCPPAPTYP